MYHINNTSVRQSKGNFVVSMFATLSNGKYVRVTFTDPDVETATLKCQEALERADEAVSSPQS